MKSNETASRGNQPHQPTKGSGQGQQHQSSSQQATEKAKKGEPLQADRPRDRSPKQENL